MSSQNIHSEKILILDFGSQVTQLIARRVREIGVYCEIFPYDADLSLIKNFNAQGIILSGGPESTTEEGSPRAPEWVFEAGVPVFGIYGYKTHEGSAPSDCNYFRIVDWTWSNISGWLRAL